MKPSFPTACVLLIAAVAACEERSKPPATPVNQQNPQTSGAQTGKVSAEALYERVWANVPSNLNMAAGSVSHRSEGRRLEQGGPAVSLADLDRLLEQHQNVVEDLMAAAKAPRCGFGLTSGDEHRVLTLGGNLRKATRVLVADAGRLREKGDLDGASARLEAVYGMCLQAIDRQEMLLALSCNACIQVTNSAARSMCGGEPSLATGQIDRLLAMLDRFDRASPTRALDIAAADATTRQQVATAEQRLVDDLESTRRVLESVR